MRLTIQRNLFQTGLRPYSLLWRRGWPWSGHLGRLWPRSFLQDSKSSFQVQISGNPGRREVLFKALWIYFEMFTNIPGRSAELARIKTWPFIPVCSAPSLALHSGLRASKSSCSRALCADAAASVALVVLKSDDSLLCADPWTKQRLGIGNISHHAEILLAESHFSHFHFF